MFKQIFQLYVTDFDHIYIFGADNFSNGWIRSYTYESYRMMLLSFR